MTELAVASFPIVFFDGEREIGMGTVAVHPSLWFKKFQALVGQKIGIAPHRISTSLVRRMKARPSPDVRRRVPIDEFSDFAAIARERDCFVLAVLRRNRRDGRGRRAVHPVSGGSAPEKTILRRNPGPIGGLLMPEMGVGIGIWDYESQPMNLQRRKERYLLSTAACYPYPVARGDGCLVDVRRSTAVSGMPEAAVAAAVCEECLVAREEGRAPPFHWCVHDAVTEGFRSRVGPIQRPRKDHVQAFAL